MRLLKKIQKIIAIMTFKSLNDLTQVYLKEFFQYSTDMHGYNTRSSKGKRYLPHRVVTHGTLELSMQRLLDFGMLYQHQ